MGALERRRSDLLRSPLGRSTGDTGAAAIAAGVDRGSGSMRGRAPRQTTAGALALRAARVATSCERDVRTAEASGRPRPASRDGTTRADARQRAQARPAGGDCFGARASSAMLLTAARTRDPNCSRQRLADPAAPTATGTGVALSTAPSGNEQCSKAYALWSGAVWLVPSGAAGSGSVTSGASCARTAWPRPPLLRAEDVEDEGEVQAHEELRPREHGQRDPGGVPHPAAAASRLDPGHGARSASRRPRRKRRAGGCIVCKCTL